jgi:DNA-binding FadR family transcriptional regulator
VLVSDDVFRRLTEEILSGRYEPGEKLPTQRALAKDLGVNIASVREAVKRLEQLRLVEVRQGDAMRVADWRTAVGLDLLAHLMFRAGGMDQAMLDSLMEARTLMLAESARLAAGRRSDDQVQVLGDAAQNIVSAADRRHAQAIDWAFFSTVVEASGNVILGLVMNSIRHVYFERAEVFARVVDDHQELGPLYVAVARAIADQKAEEAEQAARALAEAQAERLR